MKPKDKPAWMSGNWDEAMLAADAETDPAILAEIAEKAPLRDVREVAVDLLEDASLLAGIAAGNSDPVVRICALKKVYASGYWHGQDAESVVAGLLHGASEKDLKSLLPELVTFLPEEILAKFDIRAVRSELRVSGHELETHQEIYYKGKLMISGII